MRAFLVIGVYFDSLDLQTNYIVIDLCVTKQGSTTLFLNYKLYLSIMFQSHMLRLLIAVIFCCSIVNTTSAQSKITEPEWNKLTKALSEEHWKEAEPIAANYLARFKGQEDTLNAAAIIRYMYLRCVAARLANKEYTPTAALTKVKKLYGKDVISPVLKFKQDGIFNFIKIGEDKQSLFLCGANDAATQIHTFETYNVSEDTTLTNRLPNLEGHYVRLLGTIKEIKNGGVAMPHLEILLINTLISVEEE